MRRSPIGIGRLNETTLHRELKEYYTTQDSLTEIEVDGFVIDVVRPDELIEIQCGSFSQIKKKLKALLPSHRIRLVHPIAVQTVISLYNADGTTQISKRCSPQKKNLAFVARELIYLREFIPHPSLSIEVVFIRQEETRKDDKLGSWRRRGISISDRCILELIGVHKLCELEDYLDLLPPGLPQPFGNRELATHLAGSNSRGRQRLAGQITYLLKGVGVLRVERREGNRNLFSVCKKFNSIDNPAEFR